MKIPTGMDLERRNHFLLLILKCFCLRTVAMTDLILHRIKFTSRQELAHSDWAVKNIGCERNISSKKCLDTYWTGRLFWRSVSLFFPVATVSQIKVHLHLPVTGAPEGPCTVCTVHSKTDCFIIRGERWFGTAVFVCRPSKWLAPSATPSSVPQRTLCLSTILLCLLWKIRHRSLFMETFQNACLQSLSQYNECVLFCSQRPLLHKSSDWHIPWLVRFPYPFEHCRELYVPPGLTFKNSSRWLHCFCVFSEHTATFCLVQH
jgi:hypothetical protein